MKEIKLTQNKFALVDDEDFERVIKYKWHLDKGRNTFYARTNINGKKIRMHRFICNVENKSILIDHKDCNGLNNVKSNLRVCNMSKNEGNSYKKRISSSKYKGVTWYKPYKKWRSQIMYNYKNYNLGYFETETEAAIRYNQQALIFFGEFARINIINE